MISTKQAREQNGLVTFATYTNGDAATYYNGISETASGNTLLTALRSLNLSKRKDTVGYSSMGTTPSGMFKYTDYDPDYVQYDSNGQPYGTRISSFYTYTSATSWNREHVWPNSHGGGSGGNAGSPYPDADIHMPRPTISSENSSRGNSFFVEGMNHSSNGWDPYTAGYNANSRGEAARITFYCMLVNSKLNLAPSNTTPSGTDPVTGISYGSGHTMGNLETLIKWNINYPVTQREKNRNEGAEYLQGNRNAFVDHPEYACRIWGNVNSTTKSLCAAASWDTGTGVSMSRDKATIAVDDTITLTATSSDNSTITWTTSDNTVAAPTSSISSSGANMTIEGIGPGTATITATATIKGSAYSATCLVTVSSSGGDTPASDSYSIAPSDLPNSYTSSDSSYTADSGISFTVKNCANYSSKIQFKSGGSYLYNNSSLNLGQLTLTGAGGGGSITVYAGSNKNPGGTAISGSNGVYDLSGNNYFKISNSSGNVVTYTGITVSIASSTKTLSSITLSDETIEFDVGEEFVKPTVTATYSDGSTADVTSNATCTGYNMNTAGDYTVTVSYSEGGVSKSSTYSITVVEPVKELVSISVSNQTTSFVLNGNFTFGGKVTATFDNGSTADVTSSATFSGYNMSTSGNQTVTVSYTYSGVTKTTTYQISVSESGQAATFSGDYNYSNQGTTWTLSNCSDSNTYWLCPSSGTESIALISGVFTNKTITSNVTITINSATYGSGSVPSESTYSVYNSEACTTSVNSTQSGTLPTDKNYTDVIYTVSLAEAQSKFSSDLAIKITKPGRQIRLKSITVSFSYTSGGSVTPTLNSITLDTTNVQKAFEVGDTFNYTGLVVTAHYSDNTNPVINTGYTVSSPDMSTAGSKTITVTYNGKSATYTIAVSEVTPQPTSDYSLTSGSPYINGVAYKMYFTKSSTNYYFVGEIQSTYYGKTSTTKSSGVDVYFEQNGSGQNIYMMKSGNKKYFYTASSNGHINFKFDGTSAPTYAWTYDSTNKTMKYNTDYIGADSSHNTITAEELAHYVKFETTDSTGAIAFATIMNDYITCNNSGTTAPTFRSGFNWTSFANVYSNLDSTSKTMLQSDSPSNAEVLEFVTRYDYIVGKYGTSTYSDFLGRNPSPIGNHLNLSLFESNKNIGLMIVYVASILSLTAIGGYFLLRKKKQK